MLSAAGAALAMLVATPALVPSATAAVRPSVCIAGGGIGGLFTAVTLRRHTWRRRLCRRGEEQGGSDPADRQHTRASSRCELGGRDGVDTRHEWVVHGGTVHAYGGTDYETTRGDRELDRAPGHVAEEGSKAHDVGRLVEGVDRRVDNDGERDRSIWRHRRRLWRRER